MHFFKVSLTVQRILILHVKIKNASLQGWSYLFLIISFIEWSSSTVSRHMNSCQRITALWVTSPMSLFYSSSFKMSFQTPKQSRNVCTVNEDSTISCHSFHNQQPHLTLIQLLARGFFHSHHQTNLPCFSFSPPNKSIPLFSPEILMRSNQKKLFKKYCHHFAGFFHHIYRAHQKPNSIA